MSDTYVADGSREAVVAWLDTLGEYGQVYNVADSFIMHLYNAGFIISERNWVDKQNELAVEDELKIEALEKNLKMIHEAWDDYKNAEHPIDQAFALSSFANVIFATQPIEDEIEAEKDDGIIKPRMLANGGKILEMPDPPLTATWSGPTSCYECGSTDREITKWPCDDGPNDWHYQ